MDNCYDWKLVERTHASDVLAKLGYDEHIPVDREEIRKALGFAIGHLNQAVPVIAEFVADIAIMGDAIDDVRFSETDDDPGWPDLVTTYEKAKAFMVLVDA